MKMKSIHALSALAVLMSLSFAYACSCIPPKSPIEEMNASAAVFQGKVLSIDKELLGYNYNVVFEVQKSWKGIDGKETIEIFTGQDSAMCGYAFEVNKTYIVYAYDSDEGLATGLCTRTAEIDYAEEDLEALGEPVSENKSDTDSETEELSFLAKIRAWIVGLFS